MYSLDEVGVDATVELLHGAFTLVWWDDNQQTINLVRNKERPMKYAYTLDGKALYYASEAWMLTVSAMRCGVKLGEIFDLPEYKLLTIDIGKGYNKYTMLLNSRVTMRTLKPHVPYVAPKPIPKPITPYNYAPQSKDYVVDFTLTTVVKADNVDTYFGKTKCGGLVEVKHWGNKEILLNTPYTGTCTVAYWNSTIPTYKMTDHSIKLQQELLALVDWRGFKISQKELNARLAKGCSWCGEATALDDFVAISANEYVCGGCKDLPEVKIYLEES
jgi:hypothetical protein